MYILMWGCFLMTSAIFTISFDEGRGWTDEALDRACLIAPWLVSLGYITMYSALFMKVRTSPTNVWIDNIVVVTQHILRL